MERQMTFLIAQAVRNDSPVQAAPKAQTPAPTNPAVHGGYDTTGRFKFHSEQDRINWLRKGYRQGVNPEAFEHGTVLHPDEAADYASGAIDPPHHVFQGPDGIHRGKNAATHELPEIHDARMRAWDGVRFKDVDPHAEKHVGEDEALKLMAKGSGSNKPVDAPPIQTSDGNVEGHTLPYRYALFRVHPDSIERREGWRSLRRRGRNWCRAQGQSPTEDESPGAAASATSPEDATELVSAGCGSAASRPAKRYANIAFRTEPTGRF